MHISGMLKYQFSCLLNSLFSRLVEEFMLLANIATAHHIHCSFPDLALLRRHPPPKTKMVEELQELCDQLGIDIDLTSAGALHVRTLETDEPQCLISDRSFVLEHNGPDLINDWNLFPFCFFQPCRGVSIRLSAMMNIPLPEEKFSPTCVPDPCRLDLVLLSNVNFYLQTKICLYSVFELGFISYELRNNNYLPFVIMVVCGMQSCENRILYSLNTILKSDFIIHIICFLYLIWIILMS